MAENKITISSPDIVGLDQLYTIYTSLAGNNSKSKDDFYSFLSINSVDREVFLKEYCIYEFVRLGRAVVLSLKPKE